MGKEHWPGNQSSSILKHATAMRSRKLIYEVPLKPNGHDKTNIKKNVHSTEPRERAIQVTKTLHDSCTSILESYLLPSDTMDEVFPLYQDHLSFLLFSTFSCILALSLKGPQHSHFNKFFHIPTCPFHITGIFSTRKKRYRCNINGVK